MSTPPDLRSRRVIQLLLAGAIAIGMVGFLTGTRDAHSPAGYRPAPPAQASTRVVAPRYRDMATARYAARAEAQRTALAAMRAPPRALDDAVQPDAHHYADDVNARSGGRAYDGAPPTIPHAVDQSGAPACLACHGEGVRVANHGAVKLGKPMSHTAYASCLQCHVTRTETQVFDQKLTASVAERSAFVGLASPGHGPRAYVGAPPQMPHRSFMRERCASCHGVWAEGLASSHPYRQSCTQCHTPAADADQMPRSPLAALPALGESP